MKMLKVALAALVMVAMVTPVIAEDRLSLSGEMRVRGWHSDLDADWEDSDSTETYGDQRLRIGGKIAVAEGVSITFRTDITESTWGSGNTFGSGRTGVQQWDRAHLDLVKGDFHVRAGQQYVGYGMTYVVDSQDNGVAVDYKFGDVPFNAFVLVDDDGATDGTDQYIIDTDEFLADGVTPNPTYLDNIVNPDYAAASAGTDNADAFLYGVKIAPKFGDVATQFFIAGFNDGNEEDVYLFGANMNADFGGVKVAAELDVFDGDADKDTDAFGTQFMLDGSMALSDAFTLGGQFFYGAGDDEDVQYTSIGNGFNSWDPVMDVGTSLSNWEISYGNPFNVASTDGYEGQGFQLASAGSVGGRLYTNYMASDALSFGASVGYFVSEEDKIADIEVMALAAGLVYKVMENTSLQLQLQYTDGTINETDSTIALGFDGDQDYDTFRAGTGLFVKF
jgi:hypothetical protein